MAPTYAGSQIWRTERYPEPFYWAPIKTLHL